MKYLAAAVLALEVCYALAIANPPPTGWTTDARVLSVYDGDTLELEVRRVVRVRLLDCWAPEIRGGTEESKAAARASRDHLRQLVASGKVRLHVPTRSDRVDELFSFGRVLGYVWAGETNVSEAQVEAGHATKTKGAK